MASYSPHHLRIVSSRLNSFGLIISATKCVFDVSTLEVLVTPSLPKPSALWSMRSMPSLIFLSLPLSRTWRISWAAQFSPYIYSKLCAAISASVRPFKRCKVFLGSPFIKNCCRAVIYCCQACSCRNGASRELVTRCPDAGDDRYILRSCGSCPSAVRPKRMATSCVLLFRSLHPQRRGISLLDVSSSPYMPRSNTSGTSSKAPNFMLSRTTNDLHLCFPATDSLIERESNVISLHLEFTTDLHHVRGSANPAGGELSRISVLQCLTSNIPEALATAQKDDEELPRLLVSLTYLSLPYSPAINPWSVGV